MSGIQHPVWREGVQRLITVDPPSAGKDWSVVVAAKEGAGLEGVWWRVKGIFYRFVTSAAAGQRFHRLLAAPGDTQFDFTAHIGNAVAMASTFGNFGSSASFDIWAHENVPGASGNGGFQLAWPFDVRLPQGYVIGTETAALDGADQFTNIRLWIQELIYVPPVDLITGQLASMTDKIVAAVGAAKGNCVLAAASATKQGSPT